MIRLVLLLWITIRFSFHLNAQWLSGTEIGIDGSFSGSNVGGAAACGIKFGFKTSENFIFGPSIRFNRAWTNFNGNAQTFKFTNWGGGFFAHARYANVLFGGIEAEIIQNKNNTIVASAVFKKNIPTVFVCGGFSKEFKSIVRVNFGLYYDLVNSENSPYRNAYIITIRDPQTGQVVKRLPVLYRLTFFFPLHCKKKEVSPEDETSEN